MSRALWLPDVLRDFGLPVRTIPGWETRGREGLNAKGVVAHHVGISGGGDSPGLRVVTYGRPGLENSLCHVHLSRSGIPTVVASGVAWHAGRGGWHGLAGNASVLGIEAEGTTGEPATRAWLDGYLKTAAALCHGLETAPAFVCAHHEWRSEKPDPWALLNTPGGMPAFRTRLAARLAAKENDVPAPTDVTDVLTTPSGRGRWLLQYDGGIITEGDAPFYGSYPGLAPQHRQGKRGFYVLTVRDDGKAGYMAVATDRARYRFGP